MAGRKGRATGEKFNKMAEFNKEGGDAKRMGSQNLPGLLPVRNYWQMASTTRL